MHIKLQILHNKFNTTRRPIVKLLLLFKNKQLKEGANIYWINKRDNIDNNILY